MVSKCFLTSEVVFNKQNHSRFCFQRYSMLLHTGICNLTECSAATNFSVPNSWFTCCQESPTLLCYLKDPLGKHLAVATAQYFVFYNSHFVRIGEERALADFSLACTDKHDTSHGTTKSSNKVLLDAISCAILSPVQTKLFKHICFKNEDK